MENQIADYRSTIYWNPDLRTDESGQIQFDYFNAASPGTYRIVVEGINSEGQLGRTTFRYQVTEQADF